ncbi:hypothetical protein [Bradyrhizobium japonicum]|jgi:hypothetical protein|uniref:hypothetical protein n=1 Tax=Bradyrhizobium japonicum TaxID=375 RepID=UPI00209C993F|nr:hypothetical protein [Bradyrhizobium japonicum]MCP1765551.1 hypothetical protein [Bradyrhizobium japonicum]MCP1787688.1 hypothetical protein [Bradyrhizobium japonicum]MCP1809564.1 hypothetical protein [Bradyrhizobium japonicum]MCP1818498.1 hypothetical protein [Bradyrhizobium japonicum]MCP1869992.1 hypothetical protein [Bradyrhizobium japonicum]
MTNLCGGATIKIYPSTPFCAKTYYTGLRAKGCDPIIRNGGLLLNESSGDNLDKWAALHDPDGALRLECARAAWAGRTSDDEVVLLGAAPMLA